MSEEIEQLKANFNVILDELRREISALKAQPPQMAQIPMQNTPQNPAIRDATDIVSLLTALKSFVPPAPSLKDRLEELQLLDNLRNGREISDSEGGNELANIAAILKSIPQISPSPPAEPPLSPINQQKMPPAEPINEEKKEDDDMTPLTFKEYADEMIPQLSGAEIHAIKSAPKELLKAKLAEEVKKNHPDMVMSDADFEYAYRKVLSL